MARAIRMPLVAVIALGIAYLLCVSVSLRRASTVVRYLDQHIRLQMDLPHFVTTTTAKTATATGTPDLEGIGGASGVESLSEEEVGDKQKEEGGDAEEEDVSMPLAVHTNIKHNPDDLMELPPETFIGSPSSTIISIGDCQCQLVSIDCLDAMRCLQNNSQRLRRAYAGVVTRSIIKHSSAVGSNMGVVVADMPLGKILQLISMEVWRLWLSTNVIPEGLGNAPDAFVDHMRYPFCQENNLLGRRCFINDFAAEEQYGDLEQEAIAKYQHTQVIQAKTSRSNLEALQRNPFKATPLDYLLTFSHMVRITLNLRSHVHDLYHNHTVTVDMKKRGPIHEKETLRVAMHVRRGDSCGHMTSGYETRASPLDSRAQMGTTRLCYETSVYMTALQRIISSFPDRHIIVYLSTDFSQSLIDDIMTDFVDLYHSVSWKYLQYPRSIFVYDEGDEGIYIENPENKFRGILGETAVADLWHLSHGEVFIGHLGSRFGKLGWFLATARYNSFIPFFTVDGHSICCDIDEACGEYAQYVVSMENCIGKFWADSVYTSNIDPNIYFTTGAYFRKAAAMHELKFRRKKGV